MIQPLNLADAAEKKNDTYNFNFIESYVKWELQHRIFKNSGI